MEFSKDVIQEMAAYVAGNNLQDFINIKPDVVTMLSEEPEQRFEARISPASGSNNEMFCVHMQDTNPKARELGFSCGLPISITLDTTWAPREILCYSRMMLEEYVHLCETLHEFIRSSRQLACHCFEINRGYKQLGVCTINVATEIATVAARAASPLKAVAVSVQSLEDKELKDNKL